MTDDRRPQARTAPRVLKIAMNGVTGRMGLRQHLLRSILPIRDEGGLQLADGSRVQLEPVLVGRNEAKLAELAERHKISAWTTDVDEVLADPSVDVFFDAALTTLRYDLLRRAIGAGKHVFTEKPTADTLDQAVDLARLARGAGITAGVVHDKVYLPGLIKLRRLVEEGFFGRMLSLRGEFGYWVFDGTTQPAQRPSWNYRAEDGGGIVTDMFCHWNYVLENVIGPVRSVTAKAVTHLPERRDEQGRPYAATADDAAYAIFECETPDGDRVIAQINSSWTVRVHRDELVEFQVDGTAGSAVAGLHRCVAQQRSQTPMPVWNPDLAPDGSKDQDFRAQWLEVPANARLDNGFRVQWEEFLRDLLAGRPHRYDLLSAARGVQLAQLGLASSAQRRTLDVPELAL
ncbi:putative dehydrogenase [Friedmanniella endophytica]|uniref:Putative dehydrogenase n=1 Tax=Microlunatus kandeliicorticis TaxID=1759536 RepID=A0A7W3INZ6_9ACTN|nr:Gfo/Idh/MocA family oxidoreductase [Microlunatus kandeliicorticis]MBA8792578.1 putative dehydrogenase [Microlunatus kandeliicorticis]